MKRIKIIAGILLFILVTIMLGTNDEKMYVKKQHFTKPDQIIQILDSKDLRKINNHGLGKENSDIFNECLSKRKRLTEDDFNFVRMDVKEIVDLNEKQKNAIIKNYDKISANYNNTDQKITKKEAIRLKATVYNMNFFYDDDELKDEDKFWDEIITIVLIDEGEGLVVDYITEIEEKAGSES